MRDRPVPLPGQDRRVRVGTDAGHPRHRQATEARRRRLRQPSHQVSQCYHSQEPRHQCEMCYHRL